MNPLLFSVMLAASAASSVVTSADWASVMTALTSQLNVATVVEVLSSLASAAVGLAFMWWGVRKAVRSLMAAFRGGRVSIG